MDPRDKSHQGGLLWTAIAGIFRKPWIVLVLLVLGVLSAMATACGARDEIILATTTSTMDTGLLDELIPVFEKKTGYRVKPIGVGTGQALAMASSGDADVLLVHAPASEKKAVEAGDAVNRQLVMHNDFIIVGPAGDPARIKGLKTAVEALAGTSRTKSIFISRGDNSGTHKKEQELWQKTFFVPSGTWYQQSGQGMGQTLNITSEKQGYTITDRGTYLTQRNNLELEIMVEGDAMLMNVYHVMQVNPAKFTNVNAAGAKAFVEFMIEPATQEFIRKFGGDRFGQALFYPDAGKPDPGE